MANEQQIAWSAGKVEARPRPGTDERLAQAERGEQRHRNANRLKAERPTVSNAAEYDLPPDFVEQSMAKVQIHLTRGCWEQAKDTIDGIQEAWRLRKQESNFLAGLPHASKLAEHVGRLGLDVRTVHIIERHCAGTVGALLEAFPLAFVAAANFGIMGARAVVNALYRAGLLSDEEAQNRICEYQMAVDVHDHAKAISLGRRDPCNNAA